MVGISGPTLAVPFLLQQLFNTTLPPEAALPGGVLDLVAAIVVPLATLGGIPELAPQTLGAVRETAPKQFLRRGLDLFL